MAARFGAGALGVLAVVLAAVLGPTVAVGASGTDPGREPAQAPAPSTAPPLQVAAVSPWVAADGVFQVRFAPTTSLPADAALAYTVHQRLTADDAGGLRASVDRVLDGGRPGPVLRAPVATPVSQLGDPAQGLVLDVPVRAVRDGSDRVLLPTPGIHPVTLRLLDAGGSELWTQVVFLNRLPDAPVVGTDGRPGVVAVSLVLPVDATPTLAPSGSVEIDAGEQAAVAGAQRLLAEVPDAPLALAWRPNLLSGLQRSDSPADARALEAIRSARAATPVRQTDVAVDAGGLVQAGAADVLRSQVALGDRVVTDVLGRRPQGDTWWLDDTVSPAALPVLRTVGVRRVVLAPDRLRVPGGDEVSTTRELGLEGVSGLTAIANDGELTLRLLAPSSTPGLRAHAVVTDLMASWFTASGAVRPAFPGPASVLLVPPQTEPATLRALVAALGGDGPLTTRADAVPTAPAREDGRDLVATLTPRTPVDQSRAVSQHRSTQRLLDGYRSMGGGADPATATWELQASEGLWIRMDPAGRAALAGAVASGVQQRVAAITPPPSRRVVLTNRTATIPLRFRNGLPFPVELVLRARSPRLEVVGADQRTVRLLPGSNRIDLPVRVQAPGESLLRLEVTSPDGVLSVPAPPVPVAASTISGVGAALSVLSLLFLAAWWLRTHRRHRREGARADHPAERVGEPPLPAAAGGQAPVSRPPNDVPTGELPRAAPGEPPAGTGGPDPAGPASAEVGTPDAPVPGPVHAEADRG